MPRYGDLDKLEDSFKESYERLQELNIQLFGEDGDPYFTAQAIVFLEAILRTKDAPTADVVEVVRCKDCKRGKHYTNMFGHKGFSCELLCADIKPDDFCSYGERRNDGK